MDAVRDVAGIVLAVAVAVHQSGAGPAAAELVDPVGLEIRHEQAPAVGGNVEAGPCGAGDQSRDHLVDLSGRPVDPHDAAVGLVEYEQVAGPRIEIDGGGTGERFRRGQRREHAADAHFIDGSVGAAARVGHVDRGLVDRDIHRVDERAVVGVEQDLLLDGLGRPDPDLIRIAAAAIHHQGLPRHQDGTEVAVRSDGHTDRIVVAVAEARDPRFTGRLPEVRPIDDSAVILGLEDGAGYWVDAESGRIGSVHDPGGQPVGPRDGRVHRAMCAGRRRRVRRPDCRRRSWAHRRRGFSGAPSRPPR